MNVLIAGGTGFLGRNLIRSFLTEGHHVYCLSRGARPVHGTRQIGWDAKSTVGWGHWVNKMDAVINLAGKSLASWPWTNGTKLAFESSRILPGRALVEALQNADRRPKVFIQQSGINYYGLEGNPADEFTPAADDFLAELAVKWEDSTKSIEAMGIRRIVLRSAVVFDRSEGLLPLMSLSMKLFLGGLLGSGRQALPWIHIDDWVAAVRFLMTEDLFAGVYNLVAPKPASNADFTSELARVLHRPMWLNVPALVLRIILGEMSVLVLKGRVAEPKRLTESGFEFHFPTVSQALQDLFEN